jgi:AraC-like DNA-binding protein
MLLNKCDRYAGDVPESAAQTMGRGVLRPALAAERFTLTRLEPSPALQPFVDFYWILRWDLRDQPAHEQTILPHPNVNLGFESTADDVRGAGIYGVDRKLFTRSLTGQGKALGVRFRPGGFRPFWDAPVSRLTDRVIPASRVFGAAAEQTRKLIIDAAADSTAAEDTQMTGHAEAMLRSVLPDPDPAAEQAGSLVALTISDPALRRVDQLAQTSGLTPRTLQRLFSDYVGVSPKWVMRRSRLHEAAQRADSGDPVDWAELAADLGYADQAHLTRDFTATLGISPTRYSGSQEPSRTIASTASFASLSPAPVAER